MKLLFKIEILFGAFRHFEADWETDLIFDVLKLENETLISAFDLSDFKFLSGFGFDFKLIDGDNVLFGVHELRVLGSKIITILNLYHLDFYDLSSEFFLIHLQLRPARQFQRCKLELVVASFWVENEDLISHYVECWHITRIL